MISYRSYSEKEDNIFLIGSTRPMRAHAFELQ
jgi:hypothetical protein